MDMRKFPWRAYVAYYVLAAMLICAPFSWAVIVGSLPYTLTNGTTADATQVMANYQKIIDDVNANAAASGANSDITAILGLTTPLSTAQGGANHWYGGTSTGSANAQAVATLVPNSYTLVAGNSATFTAGFTNTGATTLALNATTAKNVFKRTAAGAIALTGGEIVSGGKYSVSYDGTQYQLTTPSDMAFGALTNLASGGTTDLGTIGSHNVNVTGTTGITSFGSSANTTYPFYKFTFAGALTLTHNATSLILPGSVNITTQAGATGEAEYLGSGNWRVTSYAVGGKLARVNVYTANGTWTKATGENSVLFVCAGGGGGGGGNYDTAGASDTAAGGGGGAGGWGQLYKTSPAATYTLTVGAGGTGVSNGTGNTGGNTTVGAILTCNGGVGGLSSTGDNVWGAGGAGGTASSGDLNLSGEAGRTGLAQGLGADTTWPGSGGSNVLGRGAVGVPQTAAGAYAGVTGGTCGGGGSGSGAQGTAAGAQAGGTGGVGCVIAYTYY